MAHSQICQAALHLEEQAEILSSYCDAWPSTVLKSDFGSTSSITVAFISVHLYNLVECGNFQSYAMDTVTIGTCMHHRFVSYSSIQRLILASEQQIYCGFCI